MKIKKAIFAVIVALLCLASRAAYTVNGDTTEVTNLADLLLALDDPTVSTIILKNTIELENNTVLSANLTATKNRKVIQVEEPFLPTSGKVTLTSSNSEGTLDTIATPLENEYSKYKLFDIPENCHVVISNLTLKGGFTGSRTVNADEASTGGIDNEGTLEMYDCDITRTGTALLNRPNATAVLVDCNIVRNANWYGGGILNFAEKTDSSTYINGGTLIMDRCSLSENESIGPAHGGGAAENQGLMCLNNCVIANNASTEIGGGINNCKGGDLYVINSTFTGNVTTSDDYGTTAGGAIGNAGQAGNVYIANSILADNGYDTGEYVNSASLGRYDSATEGHFCHLANTIIDATAGMDRLDATNISVKTDGLFAGYTSSGIVASGGSHEENNIRYSSDFSHASLTPGDSPDDFRLAQTMMTFEPTHYIFQLSVRTYFDYSAVLNGTGKPSMGYMLDDKMVALGPDVELPTEEMMVTVTFDEKGRLGYNAVGAMAIEPLLNPEAPDKPGVFKVTLGKFTGGKVSGVTVYGDNYISNSIVTVHAEAESAHYLNGWEINGEVIPNSSQQYVFSFAVITDTTITPIFMPVVTELHGARQRYPWNNLVDIDYSVAETNAVKYRLVILATYEDNGTNCTLQLRSFRNNSDISQVQKLGEDKNLNIDGFHRVTWDSAADGVNLKGKTVHYHILACEGEER